MKKVISLLISISLIIFLIGFYTGCSEIQKKKLVLPNYTATPAFDGEHYSWEYGDNGVLNGPKEEINITWYVDDPTFSWSGNKSSIISDEIKRLTGINLNIITPVNSDGSKLQTMIAGNALPDVISIESYSDTVQQLAEGGYVYPLNPIMDKWAPSFYEHFKGDDLFEWFAQEDGFTYNLWNYGYSERYMKFLKDGKLEPNGGMLIRKDYFEAYKASSVYPGDEKVITPQGFIDMCEWVRETYHYAAGDPVVLLNEFTSGGNISLTWLAQYFAIPFEDENGNYIDQQNHPLYDEMMLFVNELYRRNLISAANLSDNHEQVGSYISRGIPFVTLVTPQNYMSNWIAARASGVEYIPFIITNGHGDMPILQEGRGPGYLGIMISNNAKRPDRIIKLFELLFSDYGQRLVHFGIEGDSWVWDEKPVYDEEGNYISLGKIKYTDKYLNDYANGDILKYGAGCYLLANYLYIMQIRTIDHLEDNAIYFENLKKPLTMYSYDLRAQSIKYDFNDKQYKSFLKKSSDVKRDWSSKYAAIISAQSKDECLERLNSVRETADRHGYDEIQVFNVKYYKKTKERFGIEYGWPPNSDTYVKPVIKINGDSTYCYQYNN